MKKTVGYIRVSKEDQDAEKNKADILVFANDRNFGKVDFITEKISGYNTSWKDRVLYRVVNDMVEGDSLIIPELTRLGRSTIEVMEIMKTLLDNGINVYSVKERFQLDDSMQSKIMITFMALFSELERDFISKRTKEALKARKAAGVKLGRPKGPGRSKLDQFRPEIEALLKSGSSKTFIAKRYGTTLPNFYNWLGKNQIDIKPDTTRPEPAA